MTNKKFQDLKDKNILAEEGGGKKRIEAQHQKRKLKEKLN